MTKFKKSQLLILSFLAVLLSIAPLLSPSMRPTYLYFVINFLIILLGAEAGLLSLVSTPHQGGSKISNPTPIPTLNLEPSIRNNDNPVEQSMLVRNIGQDVSFQPKKFKKCPSMPSLFFIGKIDDEGEAVPDEEEDDEEVGGVLSGQELFAKAENFIGNFYKQLKMQREESWNRIYGFYQKTC